MRLGSKATSWSGLRCKARLVRSGKSKSQLSSQARKERREVEEAVGEWVEAGARWHHGLVTATMSRCRGIAPG